MIPPADSKWRPTLGMIVIAVLLAVLTLPLAGLVFFRLYENQLVRATESELIAQSAMLAAVMAGEVDKRRTTGIRLGPVVPVHLRPDPDQPYHPITPQIDLARNTPLSPRPDPRPSTNPASRAYAEIGAVLYPLLVETQKVTLAGFRLLDPFGNVIAGRDEIGQSLAHVAEVKRALAGSYASALRQRISDEPAPPLHSISRGTGIRVFAAMPVVLRDHVVGVVYMSRTPNNILRQLYHERTKVALAAVVVLAVTLAIALVFARTITGPIQQLIRRTAQIGRGDRSALRPLGHHGSREIANLSQSFLHMADRLFDRTNYIANFAAHVSHELKSPLTSIQGAAELLRDSDDSMSRADKHKFLENIRSDTERLTILVQRLRDLARADNPQSPGSCKLADTVNEAKQGFENLSARVDVKADLIAPVSRENLQIVFKHLLENASQHGAKNVDISASQTGQLLTLGIHDDGDGVSLANQGRIFDAFFTTKRETGGTGMGLGIVQLMLRAHGGSIRHIPSDRGARFELTLPAAPSGPFESA